MSWHCSQALVEEFSEGGYLDGASCALLRSGRTRVRSYFDGKKKGGSRRFPSGTTSEHSTAARGVARWISSQRASRANPTASPESKKAKPTSATPGQIHFASLEKSDRDTSYWRTSQGCFASIISDEFSETWPRAGMTHDGIAYRLPPLAPLKGGIASGLWPTPIKADARSGGSRNTPGSKAHPGISLTDAVRGDGGTGRLFPTPTRADGMGGPGCSGRQGGQNLRTALGGQLNPTWVEWLMGWPIGWSALRPLAKDRFRLWLEQHGTR